MSSNPPVIPIAARLRAVVARPEAMVAVFTVVVCIALWAVKPQFATPLNVENVSRQIAVLAVLSAGLLFVLIVGGVDISVAAQMALCSVIAASLADDHGVAVAMGIALVLAVGLGLVNGVLIAAFGLSPIVVTIATAQAWLGWALLKTTTGPITPQTDSYQDLGTAELGPIPVLGLLAVAALVIAHLLLTRTTFGRYLYATGGNETAARLAGVPVVRTKVLCYTVCGLFAGIAGVLLSSRVGSADATTGTQTMFAAYAAVFIGGVAWGGGAGTALGAAIGVILLGVVSNGLDLLAIASPYQTIVAGTLIIIAIGIHRLRETT